MGTITLSVPDELKERMSKTDWVNWSSVARRAFAETLRDVDELELKKRIRELSEISGDDTREVKPSMVREVLRSTAKASKEIRSGKRKPITLEAFDKWCREL
jgi:hypothetical protein